MYRFAFRGRWLAGHLVVVAVAALFVNLGFWQLGKLHEARAANARVETRRAEAPVDLTALTAPGDPVPASLVQRRVTASGVYDRDRQYVVRFRPHDEQPGAYLLVPLRLADGSAVLVNRGWIPMRGPFDPVPPSLLAPSGEVTVTGYALPSETDERPAAASAGTGNFLDLTRIEIPSLQRTVPYRLAPVFIQLQRQEPPGRGGLPLPLALATLDEGPYLGYAVQWFLFTAVGLIGWPVLLRRRAREGRLRPGPSPDAERLPAGPLH